MQEMVNIYVYGKKYSVPGDLTIMTAMEYAGYQLKRGCGCRHGFCGACATIYRIKGKNELKTCLACQTQVEDGMYIASLPFYPIDKRTYDIEEISAEQRVMMDLYPEIYSCVGCNACTKGCPQDLNVMQYIAYAQRGDFKKMRRRVLRLHRLRNLRIPLSGRNLPSDGRRAGKTSERKVHCSESRAFEKPCRRDSRR